MKKYISRGPEDTIAIGFRLGKLLRAGDVVGLYGELGAGKTIMVKGIASALGIQEREIASASFTIISEYDTVPPFMHIDLYRIGKEDDLHELGLRELIGSNTISVIEWAEKAVTELPDTVIKVYLSPVGDTIREITVEDINEKDRNNLQDG